MPTLGNNQSYLQQELANISQSIKTLSEALNNAQSLVTSLQASLTTDEADIGSLKSSRTTDEADISSLKSSRTTDEADIASLKSSRTANESAWTAYTPTVAAATGSLASASAVGWYRAVGKTVFVRLRVTITSVGTGSGAINASLPFTVRNASGVYQMVLGRENALSGALLAGIGLPGTNTLAIAKYDGASIGANGVFLDMNGVYEAA
jgi:DNA gyrase/topoisomerase IV subunit A